MHYYPLAVITVSWLSYLWETYLDYRQYRVYKNTQKVPPELSKLIDHETFTKSKAYSIDKARFGFMSGLFGQIQTTITVCYFLMPYFWDLSRNVMINSFGFTPSKTVEWEIFQTIVFSVITSFVTTIINLPLSIYNTFVIEARHGFNKQTAAFYAWDKTKAFLVGLLIGTPIVSAMVYVIRKGGSYFPLYLWLLTFVVVCLLMFFHGEIAAIFDKFNPLPAGELRDRIEALASSIDFPLTNIFVVEGSKRSSHSNAYQSGLFNRKRIVIYDTLIEGYYKDKEGHEESEKSKSDQKKKDKGCNNDEILAVLAHELGHWYCGHLLKNLALVQANYFVMFLIYSFLSDNNQFFAAFGFYDEQPAMIGLTLLMMVLTPYNELVGFLSTMLTRYFEYQADEYGASKGYSKHLKTALVKLNIDNLGFPIYDKLYSKFKHSHPTLLERLDALDNYEKKKD